MALPWFVLFFALADPAHQASPSEKAARFAKLSAQADEARDAKRNEEAIEAYREALRLKPGWKEGWWSLGTIQYDLDRWADCRDSFRRLSALETGGGAAFSMLGLCEFGAGELDQSLKDLLHGQELGVTVPAINDVAEDHIAEIATRLEDYEQALRVLVDMAKKGKESPRLIMIAGAASLRRPLSPSAVPEADRELVFLTGQAFWKAASRRAAEAESDFQTILAKYPDAAGLHYFYGTFLLQGEPDRAVEEFQKELAISPTNVPALAALAYEYLRREDPAKGLPYARQAATLMPFGFAPHALLGRLLVQNGDVKAGVKELEVAKRLAPEDPQPRIALASAYAKLGRKEDAARERQEFVRLQQAQKKVGVQ